ncbi:hypothetical protein, conserved [Leishmania tarentolae]|uniref:Uncharacterized protein n=1 Tax=Leishmania tarentolae TaxID=5689 RepID=A0A640KCY9_LEITA|nr:hypothetical protein, conserved [Leishmania tarentolae]
MPFYSKVLDNVAPGGALPLPLHRVELIQLFFTFYIPSAFLLRNAYAFFVYERACGWVGWCTYARGIRQEAPSPLPPHTHTNAKLRPRTLTSPPRLLPTTPPRLRRQLPEALETMPVINTPFFMELRPGEELKLAQEPSAALSTSSSAASAHTTNAFAKNEFHAMVSGVAFVEEEDVNDQDAAVSVSKPPHKHGVIRVILLAHVQSPPHQGSSTEHFSKTVTLASCNFSSDRSPNGDTSNTLSSACRGKMGESVSTLPCTATRVEGTVQFRSPLLFSSSGNIQSLSVVAEDMATTAGSSGSSGSVKRYQGSRRFGVRLHGVQRTFLTKEQVMMLAQR